MTALNFPEIHETTVSDIPAFWTRAPEPLTVALHFRVGRWDESVLNHGITHLAEHLALYALRDAHHPYNGAVEGKQTVMWASGTPDEVCRFFSRLSGSIADLPLDRMEREAGVLLAESMRVPTNTFQQMLFVLYGPSGPGLDFLFERGLWRTTPAELQAWASSYFNKSNAVVTLSGEPPPGLEIALPDGDYRGFSLPGDDVGHRPRRMERLSPQGSGIAIGGLVERSMGITMASGIIQERLVERLRHDLGIIYSPVSQYEPLDEDLAFMFAAAEAQPSNSRALNHRFLETVRDLRDNGPTQREIDRLNEKIVGFQVGHPIEIGRSELIRIALDRLHRSEHRGLSQIHEERNAITPQDIQSAWSEFMETALLIPPVGSEADVRRREPYNDPPVEGARFRSPKSDPVDEVRIGDEGISVKAESSWVTIAWSDVAVAENYDNGVWTFLGRTGRWIQIDPTTFRRSKKVAETILQFVPADVIDRPPPS